MTDEELKNIPSEKFKLVNENKKLRDKELVTKPIGFFKDAMYRFSRNKGSIVGAIVIGILVLYAIIAPIFSPYTVSYNDSYYRFTLPKIFNKLDFLDGCSQKSLNENSFIYYYSMGMETGYNAIKNQSYKKNEKTNMYSFRLDSYHSVGTIFLTSVPQKDYMAIQDYQDKTGRQVIYPITDPNKRPEQAQDKNNANYWYETKVDASRTVPDNYTINEDGTVTLKDIYLTYDIPRLSAMKTEKFAPISFVTIKNTNDGKISLGLSYVTKTTDANGITTETETFEGYLCLRHSHEIDEHYFFFDDADEGEPAGLAKFDFNTTYNVPTIHVTGHQDASKDGDYYLSLPVNVGSTVNLRPLSDIDNTDYYPVGFFNKDDASQITSPTDGEKYAFGIAKTSEFTADSFISSLTIEGFSLKKTKPQTDSGDKVLFKFPLATGSTDTHYLKPTGKGAQNASIIVATNETTGEEYLKVTLANLSNPAAEWHFDKETKGIYTTVTGFTDASRNGDYYLASFLPEKEKFGKLEEYKFDLAKKETIEASDYIVYYAVCDNETVLPITEDSLDPTSAGYYLRAKKTLTENRYFFLDGNFKGDNYGSKMRVEGDDVHKYAYAVAKDNHNFEIRVNYYEYYRYYHTQILKDRITTPHFIFGTTSYGQDIFTCLASGARFSFIMAIVVAVVNMVVGAIYGALEGYYGGKVDLIMERIVEILSAVPFMIVITLLKYHMRGSSQVLILFIAFFLTGWIGMSGTVRMQFYRFKNQEYVLASRTLGAKDWRIMFKHIFPNALGTIVTSSVLVIPGMIFSETTLSYLGIINLNSGSMTSVGTLLANAQPYLVTYPHMIVFPAVFISLLMLCFNLFGNGLRDAFNPSLRGTED